MAWNKSPSPRIQTPYQAKRLMDSFSPKSSRCPLCNEIFKTGCLHTQGEAKAHLYKQYMTAIDKANDHGKNDLHYVVKRKDK